MSGTKEDFVLGSKIEHHPNPDCISIHVRDRLFTEEDATVLGQALFDELNRVTGIAEVSLSPYEIRLVKGGAFSWDEILPAVARVFAHYLNPVR